MLSFSVQRDKNRKLNSDKRQICLLFIKRHIKIFNESKGRCLPMKTIIFARDFSENEKTKIEFKSQQTN